MCLPMIPFLIWDDPQRLAWSADELAALAESEETAWMLKTLPAGAHMRPEQVRFPIRAVRANEWIGVQLALPGV